MRVKLSYTVEEEDILPQAAKLLGLASSDVQQVIDLFNQIQKELSNDSEEQNINKAMEMLDELRKALLAIDTRAIEVLNIIEGYQDYKLKSRANVAAELAADQTESNGSTASGEGLEE